ncbi:MAG: TRAM domain-containing protein [Gemmatimonadota bacterium]
MAILEPPVDGHQGVGSAVEVAVHGIGAGGLGVGALPDGKVVFLPRTAPGDRVLIRVLKEKPRWAWGEALAWIVEGPSRRPPPCPRYSRCDGCSIQHLDYPEQLFWKGRMVGDALRRLAGLETEDPEVVPSPEEFRYRNKVTFTLRRLPGGRIVAGFRELGHPGRVLDIGSECLLPEEPLSETWQTLRANWGPNASLLPEGRELRLTLRGGQEGVGLLVRGGKGDGDPQSLMGKTPGLSSVWRENKGGELRHLAGDPTLLVPWAQELLELHGGGFVQVNRSAGEALHQYVLGEAGDIRGKRIIDAYCGVGALGRALAREGGAVVGIDIDPAGVLAAQGHSGDDFRIVKGLVEEELGALLPADLAILNPPRTGLADTIPATLISLFPERIIYVSCDPATLARDLKRLGEAYEVERVRSFDLFPQTGHVETVVTLRGISE